MSAPPARPPLSRSAPVRRHSVILWILRVAATAYFALLLWQVTLAGLFVGGDVAMLSLHAQNAQSLAFALLGTTLVAALFAWVSRGARWPFWCLLPILGLVVVQFILGYSRSIPAHVGLGTSLFALSTLLLIGVWRHRYRPRPSRRERRAARDGAQREALARMKEEISAKAAGEGPARAEGVRAEGIEQRKDGSL